MILKDVIQCPEQFGRQVTASFTALFVVGILNFLINLFNVTKQNITYKMKPIILQLEEVTDYDIFVFIDANRAIDQKHVAKLVESIRRKNLLKLRPVITTSKYEVIDGQNRIAACKELGIGVPTFASDDLDYNDVVALNNSQKPWSFRNFFNFHLVNKVVGFQLVLDLSKKYGVHLNSVLAALSSDGKPHLPKAKIGEIDLGNEQGVDAILRQCEDYKENCGYWDTVNFVEAMRWLNNPKIYSRTENFTYNHELVLSKIKEVPEFTLEYWSTYRRISAFASLSSSYVIHKTIKDLQAHIEVNNRIRL